MRVSIILVVVLTWQLAMAQPTANFTLAPASCRDVNITVSNTSTNPARHQWEFCGGALAQAPVASNSAFIIPANSIEGITLVQEGGNWFGFASNTNSNEILRFDFGGDLASTPTVVNLGNTGSLLDRPRDVALIKNGALWYGLVTCFNVGAGTTKVVRLSFGVSLTNTPAAHDFGNFGNRLSQAYAVEWVADQSELIAVISDRSERKLLLVNFRTSAANTPGANSDFVEVLFPGNGFIKDFSILRDQVGWKGLAITENQNVFKLDFPNHLYQQPIISTITSSVPLSGFPNNVGLVRDLNHYYGFILQFEGDLIKLDFGNSLTSLPVVTNLGKLGILSNMQGLSFAKTNNSWVGYSNSTTGQLKKISFSAACSASLFSSNDFSPALSFSERGQKIVSLEVTNDFGEKRFHLDSVLIKTNPVGNFSWQLNCVGQVTTFTDLSTDDGTIQTWSWDFGDSPSGTLNSSFLQNPQHNYSTPGLYTVTLTVTDDCSDLHVLTKQIEINDPALISLVIDPSGPLCSFQSVSFKPLASTGLSSVTASTWDFGDGATSPLIEPQHQYSVGGNYLVQLSAIVNQCPITQSTTYLVKPGLDVNFSTAGLCSNKPIDFNNATTGGIEVIWNFGDGQSTTEKNPQHTYINGGAYNVVLAVESDNGCINTRTQTKIIRSSPQPNFSIDLPPFSCAGSASQFNDLTPALTDSNIITWTWSFGDPANGTSSQKNPTHVYGLAGDYPVSLQTTTNFGCTNTLQKTVTISTPPAVGFNGGAACLNQGTQFTDASDGTVKAWLWSIGNSSYSTKNTTHTFNSTGLHNVMLTITGNNNCVSQLTKTVTVPVAVVPDFTAISTCVNKPAVFQEKNIGGADPAVSWSWDFGGTAGSGSPAQHTFTSLGNYSVKMSSTRQSGCVYSVTKSIPITQAPKAQFSASPEIGAVPLGVGFTNTSTQATSYLWRFNDANNSTSTEFSPAFIFNQLGIYPVELIASNSIGCTDSFSKTIQIVVPAVNAALSSFKLVPFGNSMKIVVTIKNQGNLSILNPKVIVDLAGNFSFTQNLIGTILPNQELTQELSATFLRSQANYVCAGVNVIGDNNSLDDRQCENLDTEVIVIQPYPNPAQNELVVDWIVKDDESLSLIIYNLAGQIVLKQKFEGLAPGLNQLRLNVSNLPTGSYYVSHPKGTMFRGSRFSIVR